MATYAKFLLKNKNQPVYPLKTAFYLYNLPLPQFRTAVQDNNWAAGPLQ